MQDKVIGQYEKNITRTKDKFKGGMNDVIVTIKGMDYVFKGVGLELTY